MFLSLPKRILIVIVLFLYIFGFYSNYIMISQLITLGVIFFGCVGLYRNNFNVHKYLLVILSFLLLDFFISIMNPIVQGTYDFSILSTKVNFLSSIVASYFISVYFYKNYSKEVLFRILTIVFLIQSIVVCIMLLNPNLADLINYYTKNQATIERFTDSYGGARGLGITESAAFGFSITMGLLLIISTYSFLKKYISPNLYVLVLVFGIVASISAGRTAIYGLFFSWILIFVFILNNRLKNIIPFLIFNFSMIFILYILIQLSGYNFESVAIQNFYNYSMEPVLNYLLNGSLESNSTNHLINMYFPLTEKQLLIGDARYMDGVKYYLSTDAGYMRFSLFYGALWSIIFYLFFIFILFFVVVKMKKNEDKLLLILCAIGALFLQYKGEVILFSVPFNKVLFIIVFSFLLEIYTRVKKGSLE